MAAPVASGSSATHRASDVRTTPSSDSTNPATRATRSNRAPRIAARASQRSCWRSTPRAWRNRPTSDAAPTGSEARTTTTPATAGMTSTRESAGTARGLPYQSGASGSGWTTDASVVTTGAAAASLAHHRQRGDGSRPVGVSSSTKPARQPDQGGHVGEPDQVAGPRERTGANDQPVLHVRFDQRAGGQSQADAQQQPAHRMAGPATGQERAHGRRTDGGEDDGADGHGRELRAGQAGALGERRQPAGGGQGQHAQPGERPRRQRG